MLQQLISNSIKVQYGANTALYFDTVLTPITHAYSPSHNSDIISWLSRNKSNLVILLSPSYHSQLDAILERFTNATVS